MSKKSRTRKDKLKLIESTLLLTKRMIVTTMRIVMVMKMEMWGKKSCRRMGNLKVRESMTKEGPRPISLVSQAEAVFFATAFLSAVRGATISKKYISQPVCFIQTKCCGVALDVIMFAPNQPNTGKESFWRKSKDKFLDRSLSKVTFYELSSWFRKWKTLLWVFLSD